MAAKLCKEQQLSLGNNTKYSDFIDGKYFLRNKRLKRPYCSKKIASSKKFLVTDFCSNDFSEIPLAYLLYQLKPIPEISVKNISKIFY